MIADLNLIDGRYRLHPPELGAGAFGSVYKATQVVMGQDMRSVALKLFHGGVLTEENVRKQMTDALALIDLLSRLPDWEVRQHFVTIFDLGVTREKPPRGFVAMELVPGGSLEKRLRDFDKFTLPGALHYLLQIARAMAFMHDSGFVHSDLKPANVLLFRGRERDVIKIGDFGLAGRYAGPFAGGPSGGTVSYLPSEALMGLATTPSGDVFSMGVIAYEMLTGENPYNRVGQTLDPKAPDHHARMNQMQLQARDQSLRLTADTFPELGADSEMGSLAPLLDVVNKMLAAALADRYATARGVLADLERVAGELPPRLRDPEQKPGSVPDPLATLVEEGDYAIAKRDWNLALMKAGEIIRGAPGRPTGYLLQSRIKMAQADHREKTTAPEDVVRKFRLEAVGRLTAGLSACQSRSDKEELRDAILVIYECLGDLKMVEEYRQRQL